MGGLWEMKQKWFPGYDLYPRKTFLEKSACFKLIFHAADKIHFQCIQSIAVVSLTLYLFFIYC